MLIYCQYHFLFMSVVLRHNPDNGIDGPVLHNKGLFTSPGYWKIGFTMLRNKDSKQSTHGYNVLIVMCFSKLRQ